MPTLADECRKMLDQWEYDAENGFRFPSLSLTKIVATLFRAALEADDAFREAVRKLLSELANDNKIGLPQSHAACTAANAVREMFK